MRKAAICFLLISCATIAFGQQQPQWTTVASVVLFNQTQGISEAPLLTPTEPGIYRLNFYFSGRGTERGEQHFFTARMNYVDIEGDKFDYTGIVFCSESAVFSMPPTMISLKPNVPLTYLLSLSNPSTARCHYNLAITVEQLVQ